MESQCVAEEGRWDVLRLQDVRPVAEQRAVYGKDYAHQAVVAISSRIFHCKCVRQLLLHLARRQVVAASASSFILSQSDGEAARSLERLLNARSREPGIEASIVEGIYLALLDCYEVSGNAWCHGVATSELRPVARMKLKLPDVNHYDLTNILQRVSPIMLPPKDADRLNHELGLSNYGSLTDLHSIFRISFNTKSFISQAGVSSSAHSTHWPIPQPSVTLLPQQPAVGL
ncbi:hypothetical protein GBAR_LOCUS6663 [Geodia barretti]|uniref:Uncharacterized protein n=1 Tax=Geodia barretti TaxID=519541 RepID=A0AA35REJ7_GEOBA|nr:hypothetical protein GBAR_LOCUS6663 [Geodia barretti]